ncbi:unnamed protein product [Haemonchus placei]|uniref:Hydantoinase_B domain-containing protein n=1 Tax=Haemonchus placei TaxID=6290 RepID=A0A0N4X864_HAEPC|nr:unnamed protein product [Haemonchus placei]
MEPYDTTFLSFGGSEPFSGARGRMVRIEDGSVDGRRGSPSEVFSQEINDAHKKSNRNGSGYVLILHA